MYKWNKYIYKISIYKTKLIFKLNLLFKNLLEVSRSNQHLGVEMSPSPNLEQFNTCHHNPVGIYLLNVNNRNTRKRCEICSELTIKTLVSLLVTLNIFYTLF